MYGSAQVSGSALVQKTPIFIGGLGYPITITETHLFAGCQGHTFKDWREFTPEEISAMDGKKATEFYPKLIKIIDLFTGEIN